MRAVVQDEYGPPEVLHIEDVERPVLKEDGVMIRVRAATVSQTDTHARAAHPFFWRLFAGFLRPRLRTLGVDLAGEVVAIGPSVTEFKVGDEVFGTPPGFGIGTHAEFVCLSANAQRVGRFSRLFRLSGRYPFKRAYLGFQVAASRL